MTTRVILSIKRMAIAVWTVAVAFVLTLLMSSIIEPGVSPLFLIAVMVSAWRGGLGAGILATLLSAVSGAFVFLGPRFSFQLDLGDLIQLIVFTIAAVIVGTLSAARKREQTAREVLLINEQKARLEAERANRVKDEFLAAVSHELRTPLTTIKMLTRVLLRREIDEEERTQYLEDIAAECDREIDLVLNLLDVSRIRAGGMKIELRSVDVAAVLVACRKLIQGEAERLKHRVLVDVPAILPPVSADANALRRALCAIAENSIKFTPPGGQITLRAESGGEEILISVQDTGRGISDHDLPRVFDKFYRGENAGGADATEEEVHGIGLGLNLALKLVEGMAGTIGAESRINEGSTFTVRLPVWKEQRTVTADTSNALEPSVEAAELIEASGGK